MTATRFVTSADGTRIAYQSQGQGPPVIIVDGAMCHRRFGPNAPLAALLAPQFTVYTYDRRGRGESSDADAHSVELEVEDLAAILDAAGGRAMLYGISSGAALALEAASSGLAVERMALYEPPFIVDDTRTPLPDDFQRRLTSLIASGRRGAAVSMFMRFVEVPALVVALMRFLPPWRKLKAIAHTLPYDIAIVQENQRGRPLAAGRWAGLAAPTIVMDGGKSPVWMRNGARALAEALPTAVYRTLEGQTHMVRPGALAPVLIDFFSRASVDESRRRSE